MERRDQQKRGPPKAGQQQPGARQQVPRQQQGSGQSPRQQQQFDSGQRQPFGGSGADSRLADQIRDHMEVVDQSGAHVGTVDHVDGDRIKLTRSSSGSGEHSYVPLSQVAGIESNRVRLRERGDTSFGMEADR